jgi:hypothetical protein
VTLLLLTCVALSIMGAGYLIGYSHGKANGVEDAYEAVDAYYRAKAREESKRARREESW